MKCTIKMVWDSEAQIWYTESNDVPGLVLHAATFDDLVKRACDVSPELLEENLNYVGPVHLSFECERIEKDITHSQMHIAV
jgi:hypothetical protein